MNSQTSIAPEKRGTPFSTSQVFEAPRERLFELWTDPAHLENWFSPAGFKTSYIKRDIRPGGVSHFSLSGARGSKTYGKINYRVVEAPCRLVYVQFFADESGVLARHPSSPRWPLQMLTTIEMRDQWPRTLVTLTGEPLGATADEQKFFDESHFAMFQGWKGAFAQLSAYLSRGNK